MNLPVKPLPSAEVEGITVLGLSRSAALHFTTAFTEEAMPDGSLEDRVTEAEVYLLMQGTGSSDKECRRFRDEGDVTATTVVIEKIIAISGLSDTTKEKPEDPKE